ncbi:MAG: hypothetical protein O7A98_11660 [Acidobacteria bacterium]|nr:hypothetical protein [Acidobacteriota bacterium]
MSRVLIGPSALNELRALEPLAGRRQLIARLSELGKPLSSHRISSGGCCRLLTEELRVLYRHRDDGTLVITGVTRTGVTSLDSARSGIAGALLGGRERT